MPYRASRSLVEPSSRRSHLRAFEMFESCPVTDDGRAGTHRLAQAKFWLAMEDESELE